MPLNRPPPFFKIISMEEASTNKQWLKKKHFRADVLEMLHAKSRARVRPRGGHDERLPRMPREVHVQDPRGEIPGHHARGVRSPAHHRPEKAAGEAGSPRGRAAPRPRRLRALQALVPLVPVLVLREGAPLRPLPRRGRAGPRPGVGQPHDLRLVQPRAELRPRSLCLLRA